MLSPEMESVSTASTLPLLPARLKIAWYANLCYNHIFACSVNIPLVEITQKGSGPGISILAIGLTVGVKKRTEEGWRETPISPHVLMLSFSWPYCNPSCPKDCWGRDAIPFNCSSKNHVFQVFSLHDFLCRREHIVLTLPLVWRRMIKKKIQAVSSHSLSYMKAFYIVLLSWLV